MPKVGETKAVITWEPKTVILQRGEDLNSLKPTKIKGVVHGSFSVHEEEDGGWTLSHLPTGLRVLTVKTVKDAKRIGEYLWRRFCLAFREKNKEDVKRKLLPWVEGWLKRIDKETEAWIDPQAEG